MNFTTFEEPIGHFTGDPKVTADTIDLIYKMRDQFPDSDGHSNIDGWQKDIGGDPAFHPIIDVLLDKFDLYLQRYD